MHVCYSTIYISRVLFSLVKGVDEKIFDDENFVIYSIAN